MNETWARHLKIDDHDIKVSPTIKSHETKWKRDIDIDVDRMKKVEDKITLKKLLYTYCYYHNCDGYVQGMNCVAWVMLTQLKDRAFWGLVKYMGHIRTHLHCIDLQGFLHFCASWETLFHEFSDGLHADQEHVMALKWGIYAFTTTNTELEEIITLWNAMLTYPTRLWTMFTAAVAAAACRREIRNTTYNPQLFQSKLNFNDAPQLVRRAKRMMKYRMQKKTI